MIWWRRHVQSLNSRKNGLSMNGRTRCRSIRPSQTCGNSWTTLRKVSMSASWPSSKNKTIWLPTASWSPISTPRVNSKKIVCSIWASKKLTWLVFRHLERRRNLTRRSPGWFVLEPKQKVWPFVWEKSANWLDDKWMMKNTIYSNINYIIQRKY